MKKQVFVFGDVHGQLDQLKKLIEKAKREYSQNLDLYSVGDLVDRGPDSKKVVQFCIDNGVKAITGNHELWLQEYLEKGIFYSETLHPVMGGAATVRSYLGKVPGDVASELAAAIPQGHKDYLLGLPRYRRIEVDGELFWIVHAGIKNTSYQALSNAIGETDFDDEVIIELAFRFDQDTCLWNRAHKTGSNLYNFKYGTQVMGHTIFPTPQMGPGYIMIDTGCGGGSTLTGIALPQREFLQVGP